MNAVPLLWIKPKLLGVSDKAACCSIPEVQGVSLYERSANRAKCETQVECEVLQKPVMLHKIVQPQSSQWFDIQAFQCKVTMVKFCDRSSIYKFFDTVGAIGNGQIAKSPTP